MALEILEHLEGQDARIQVEIPNGNIGDILQTQADQDKRWIDPALVATAPVVRGGQMSIQTPQDFSIPAEGVFIRFDSFDIQSGVALGPNDPLFDRFTVNAFGAYDIEIDLTFGPSHDIGSRFELWVNGSKVREIGYSKLIDFDDGQEIHISAGAYLLLDVDDYIQVFIDPDSATEISLNIGSRFEIERIL